MNPANEVCPVHQHGSIVASGGTTVCTGADWAATYEPNLQYMVTVGANAAGAVVCTVEQSDTIGSGYATVGTIAAGSVAGISTLNLGALTERYIRSTITATGGTANVGAAFIAKPRQVG